jgi:hypothetical protein
MAYLRLSEVSAERRAFVRECQRIGFGEITGLLVRDSEPVFSDETAVLLDLKLDSDPAPRPEQSLPDFAVASEVVQLFAISDKIGNGTLVSVEVRSGIPRRIRPKALNSINR